MSVSFLLFYRSDVFAREITSDFSRRGPVRGESAPVYKAVSPLSRCLVFTSPSRLPEIGSSKLDSVSAARLRFRRPRTGTNASGVHHPEGLRRAQWRYLLTLNPSYLQFFKLLSDFQLSNRIQNGQRVSDIQSPLRDRRALPASHFGEVFPLCGGLQLRTVRQSIGPYIYFTVN